LFAQLGDGRGFDVAIEIEDKDAWFVLFRVVFGGFFLRLALRFQRFLVEQFGV